MPTYHTFNHTHTIHEWVTIRVTALPFPPADSPSEPKRRTVLTHCSLSDLNRRKIKAS